MDSSERSGMQNPQRIISNAVCAARSQTEICRRKLDYPAWCSALGLFVISVSVCLLTTSVLNAQSFQDVNHPGPLQKLTEAKTTAGKPQSFKVHSKPTGQLAEQLRRSKITAPVTPQDGEQKDELERLIAQIRSVRFKPEPQSPGPSAASEPETKMQPPSHEARRESAPAQEMTEEPPEKQQKKLHAGPAAPDETLAQETLQLLENISQGPAQLHRPAEVAEILFLSGRLKKAAAFYQQALDQADPNDASTAHDRAWMLFQIGNCLRDDDPTAAGNVYRKLLSEFPDSPWANLAHVWEQFTHWYEKDEPYALLSESESSF